MADFLITPLLKFSNIAKYLDGQQEVFPRKGDIFLKSVLNLF